MGRNSFNVSFFISREFSTYGCSVQFQNDDDDDNEESFEGIMFEDI